jgi:hypothetical protein
VWGEKEMLYSTLFELSLWVTLNIELDSKLFSEYFHWLGSLFLFVICDFKQQYWKVQNHSPLIKLLMMDGDHEATFLEVIMGGSTHLASDPRDYIFALLAHPLARKGNGQPILEPDYNKSIDKVFLEFALTMLDMPREADCLLALASFQSETSFETRSGPSWVPYWDAEWECGSLKNSSGTKPFAGGYSQQFKYNASCEDGSTTKLNLSGYIIEGLIWTSGVISVEDLELNTNRWTLIDRPSQQSYLDILLNECIAGIATYEKSTDDVEEAFSLTLIRANLDRRNEMNLIDEHRSSYQAYKLAMQRAASQQPQYNLETSITERLASFDYASSTQRSGQRKFAWTSSRRLCLVPALTKTTDICTLIPGLKVPFILRPTDTPSHYSLVGDCYIDGIMRGELFDDLQAREVPEQEIILV